MLTNEPYWIGDVVCRAFAKLQPANGTEANVVLLAILDTLHLVWNALCASIDARRTCIVSDYTTYFHQKPYMKNELTFNQHAV